MRAPDPLEGTGRPKLSNLNAGLVDALGAKSLLGNPSKPRAAFSSWLGDSPHSLAKHTTRKLRSRALDVLRSAVLVGWAHHALMNQREQSNCAHSLFLPFIAPSLHAPEAGLAEFRLCLRHESCPKL